MIGIDAVDIERLRDLLEHKPEAEQRLFTDTERTYCRAHSDPALHFAGTLAAKEAVIKAASLGPLVSWSRRIEIDRGPGGVPMVKVVGIPDPEMVVSISHDGGLAVAVAMVQEKVPRRWGVSSSEVRPNERLLSYLGFPTS